MVGDDAALQSWKRHFDPTFYVGNPTLRPISTLQELEGKLTTAINVVDTFDGEGDQRIGMALATMAIDFGCQVLGQLGVLDADGPTPKPLNLKMAKSALLNLVNTIHQEIGQHRIAVKSQVETDENESIELSFSNQEVQTESRPVFHPKTFSVEWQGRSLKLGSTVSYSLFDYLCQNPGQYIHIDTLIEKVWKGKAVSDEAVQKQVSNLRKKLAKAGFEGIKFDGDQPKHYRLMIG